jgi:hypothetical protein
MGVHALVLLAALPLAVGAGCARDPLRAIAPSDGAAAADASGGDAFGDQLIILDHDAPAVRERPPPVPITCPGTDARVELRLGGEVTVLRAQCPVSANDVPFEAGAFSYSGYADDEGGEAALFIYACGDGKSTFDLTIPLLFLDVAGRRFTGATLLLRDAGGVLNTLRDSVSGVSEVEIPAGFSDDTAVGTTFSGSFTGEIVDATGRRLEVSGRYEACHIKNHPPRP